MRIAAITAAAASLLASGEAMADYAYCWRFEPPEAVQEPSPAQRERAGGVEVLEGAFPAIYRLYCGLRDETDEAFTKHYVEGWVGCPLESDVGQTVVLQTTDHLFNIRLDRIQEFAEAEPALYEELCLIAEGIVYPPEDELRAYYLSDPGAEPDPSPALAAMWAAVDAFGDRLFEISTRHPELF